MTSRTHDDGNGDFPMWLRAAFRYGVPSVLALYLTWVLTNQVTNDVGAMRRGLATMSAEHAQIRFYLRAICFNSATTEGQRANCVTPDEYK